MNNTVNENSEFILIDDAARELNFSKTHIIKLIERRYVKTEVIDGSLCISVEEFNHFKIRLKKDKDELMERFANREDIERNAAAEIAEML